MPRGATRRRTSIAAVATAAIGLIGLGALAAVLIVPPSVPSGLEPGDAPTAAPVAQQAFDDARSVAVRLQLGPELSVTSNAGGVVTTTHCAPGAVIAAGSAPFSVDGRPLLALATRIPLWRDLEPGDHGDDVAALQEQLRALGHDVAVDGMYGWTTRLAVQAATAAIGAEIPSWETLPLAAVIWIPTGAAVSACKVIPGDRIGPGTALATLPAVLQGISVINAPTDLTAGDRVLDFGDLTLATDPAGAITDVAALASLTTSRNYPALLEQQQQGEGLSVRWLLQEPISVIAVPPQALYNQNGSTACLDAGNAARPVRIVSSNLGLSLIILTDDGPAPTSVSLDPDPAPCD